MPMNHLPIFHRLPGLLLLLLLAAGPAGDPWETFPEDTAGQTLVTVPCRPCPPNPRPYRIHP